jgi:hypothetical protein
MCKPFKESRIDNQPHGIDSLESILELLKCLQIRALYAWLRFIASISCRYKSVANCAMEGMLFFQQGGRAQHDFSLSWLGAA